MPAHDEVELLADTLRAIRVARRALPPEMTSTLVVVADACADDTAQVARSLLHRPTDQVVEIGARCVGEARRVGTEAALSRSPHPLSQVWIASTDADTVVPPTWLCAQLDQARRGAAALAGTVALRAGADGLDEAFRRRYLVERDGSHQHVHGANLGLRADLYVTVGGWRPLDTGEDHDLWRRVADVVPPISTTANPVLTSARRSGRAPHGFADGIDELSRSVA